MTYSDVPDGAFFRIKDKPHKLWQKLEHCACSMEWNVMFFRDDVEVVLESTIAKSKRKA